MSKQRQAHLDADESALFLRQAELIIARTYDVVYPQYKALLYIPISNEGGPGIDTITYRQYDWSGMAKIVNNYATDFPRVDVRGKEFSQKVKPIGDSYAWNVDEIRKAQTAGVPLDAMRARTAREAIMRKMNKIAWFGDTESGLKGIVYHPNVTKVQAPNGTWSSATPDHMIADVADLINGPKILTKDAEFVDTVILPTASMAILRSTPRSTLSDTSVLQWLQYNFPEVTFLSAAELGALAIKPSNGAAGPTNVMIGFRRDPSKVWFAIPSDFEQLPPQAEGLEMVVYCDAHCGGLIVPYPLNIQVSENI